MSRRSACEVLTKKKYPGPTACKFMRDIKCRRSEMLDVVESCATKSRVNH